jgi:hypothetical protein
MNASSPLLIVILDCREGAELGGPIWFIWRQGSRRIQERRRNRF